MEIGTRVSVKIWHQVRKEMVVATATVTKVLSGKVNPLVNVQMDDPQAIKGMPRFRTSSLTII